MNRMKIENRENNKKKICHLEMKNWIQIKNIRVVVKKSMIHLNKKMKFKNKNLNKKRNKF